MNSLSNIKFIKDIIKREVIINNTGEIIDDIEIVIKLKNMTNGKSRIHRMTDFLTKYRNNKPKYVSDIADNIVKFLNYIYFELNNHELKNIEYLTFEEGAIFLQQYSIGKSKNTVKRMERNLTNFYYFLAEKSILINIKTNDFTMKENKNGTFSIESPFTGLYKQFCIEGQKPIHTFEIELMFIFLDKVLEVSPQIALGVYIQIFGGLRISEIINLKYSNLSIKGINARNGIVANIKFNNLRPELKSSAIRHPKKIRKQLIISVPGLIEHIYEQHIKNYKSSFTDAVFIDGNGLPMTSDIYRYYFNKAKEAFINNLTNSNELILKSKGLFLQNQKWSTHIGRGIFSNMVSDVASNIVEIAAWRGDSNLNSSLSYIMDNSKIENQIVQVMGNLYNKHLHRKYEEI